MATSNDRQVNKTCPFFLNKSCRYGENCRYSHSTGNNWKPCIYFARGYCTWGDKCRFSHVIANKDSNSNGKFTPSSTYRNMHSQRSFNGELMNKRTPTERNTPKICPQFNSTGSCLLIAHGNICHYAHGDMCDLCKKPFLHPYNSIKRDEHRESCNKRQQEKQEKQLAKERSQDKTCGICLDNVWAKDEESRFGLLENCDHVFCLKCIRTWRGVSNYEHSVVKSCPECRTKSDFITPVKYWPKDSENKVEEIRRYKENLKKIHCKHYQRGDGVCPFGSRCFYLHMNKEGVVVELDPPKRQRRRILSDDEPSEISEMLLASLTGHGNFDHAIDEFGLLSYDNNDFSSFTFDSDDDDNDVVSIDSAQSNEESSINTIPQSSFWS